MEAILEDCLYTYKHLLPMCICIRGCLAGKKGMAFCIASGRHMVLEDWSACPQCKFPALATEFLKVLENESACPMCSERVSAADIVCEVNPLGDRDSYFSAN
ncbi:hypothetical protein L7F22_032987 [Adiantum nelumboides]|nr:hypothetical protein [Adiantum nelumboides]